MSAGATPSDRMSEPSALPAFAVAAVASPAVFSVFVTQGYAGEVGRGVDAAFACNLDPVVIGDVDQAIERHGWRHGERGQGCEESESAPHGFLSGWKRVWRRVRREHGASPLIPIGRLESE